MAAALPVAALALSVGGTVYKGVEENKAARREARQEQENGRLSLKAGEQDAMDVLRQALFEQGNAAADMASSGLAFGGSISTVLADSSRQAEMDIDRVRERARGEAANHYAQAIEDRKAGKAALVGSVFSALSQAVGGVSDMRNSGKLTAQAARERAVRLGSTGSGASYGGGTYYGAFAPGAFGGRS